MILADTSVWIDHFRGRLAEMVRLLEAGEVAMHPFVVGELACGRLSPRTRVLDWLQELPGVPLATQEEALRLVDEQELFGCGIGWVDVHLLASCRLGGCGLWTFDRRLSAAARRLRI